MGYRKGTVRLYVGVVQYNYRRGHKKRLPYNLCYAEKGKQMSHTLSCVYCGIAYPEGTPPHSSKVLTDHIKVCEKHPMAKLRKALADMIGASTKEELEPMKAPSPITVFDLLTPS